MKTVLLILLQLPFLAFSQTEKGVNPVAQPSTVNRPPSTVRAVVIGISDYQEKDIPDLRFADKDAEAFANYLRSPAGGSLTNDQLSILTNNQATAGRVAEALDALVEQTKEGDQVIIYFSGHGDVERKTVSQPGFLLCWDSPARVYMGGGTYSLAFLQEIVTTLSTQNKAKVVVVTDACHAGKLAGSQIGGSQLTAASLAKQFSNEVKILSCQPGELSLEGEQWGGGRGIFSYHLVDGLFGLADKNGDGQVTLGEIDRYLEDKVTAEAAPQSQVPMLLGNKTERLATVNSQILADLKKAKSSGMPVFAATEGRGFEEEILAKADSSVRQLYFAFKKAVAEKRFFEPADDCAEAFYASLSTKPGLTPLHGFLKRNYAAALQDDAQQAMNIWLAADVQQLECIGKTLKLDPIPRQLQRAAELLGEGHYMYRSLQARRLLFEGIMKMKHENLDERLGRECFSLFQQSLALEPQSALPWHRMSLVYANNLRMTDSAFVCARQARSLAPNWVLPYADLGYTLSHQNKFELAKQALEEAEAIDSLHAYVLNRWANWLTSLGGKANQEKAVALFDKYKESGGPLYPCWFNDYGMVLYELGRFSESEAKCNEALALDSTTGAAWSNLGRLYNTTRRYAEAEPVLKKAVGLDSTVATAWNNLGFLYLQTRRYAEAEPALTKAIGLDSTHSGSWNNLGLLYLNTRRYAEAEPVLTKAIGLDSTHSSAWSNLGLLYLSTQRYAEAEPVLKKAIALDSTNVNFCINLGGLYYQTHRYTEAEPLFKKAIALDSMNVSTRNNLGALYLQTRRYAEAEAVFNKAIALDSAFANARKHLGMVCFKTNRPDEARQHFLKAIALNPNYAGAMLGMAYLLHSEGKTTEAIGYVEQAIGKGATLEQLEKDEDLAPLREQAAWKALMKKHFPDKVKD